MEKRKSPKGFIVVLPGEIIEIPQDSDKSWLTLFYSLPRELAEKWKPAYDLPRCPYEVLRTDKYDHIVCDDMFKLLVWDCYAWSAWQFFQVKDRKGNYRDIPGAWTQYAGYFPLWRLSYSIIPYIRMKFEKNGLGFQNLYNVPQGVEVPWLTYQQFSNLIGNVTDMVVAEQEWQPVIDAIWENRTVEDYETTSSTVKTDFMRKWHHNRSGKPISLDEMMESEDGDIFDVADPRSEFENSVISEMQIASFAESTITEKDREILKLRMEGYTEQEIADKLGYKTASAVHKRIAKIANAYEDYADKADCKWSATTIIRILQDETYTGTLVQGKQGTPHYKIKQMEQRPASEWVRVPEAHEPLIARQDFELVQRIKGLDTRTSPKEDAVYLFSGILICGCCGSRMTRKTNRAGGKEYHYYYCPTGKKKGCTHPVMLKESSLIACVRDSLKAYIDNVASLETLLADIDQASINQALAKEYSDHITDNERRLEQVLEFKARLYESLVGGMLTKEEYASYKAKYTKQAEDIKESIRVLKEKLTDVLENRSERNRWISQFTQFATLETLDRRALIHMVQSIRVMGKKELAIAFTYEDEYKKALQLIKLAAKNQQTEEFEHRKAG